MLPPPPCSSRTYPLFPYPTLSRFTGPSALFLEIGFGGGGHLAWQAQRHPEAGFLAAEYFITGVASLLGQLRAAGDAPSLRLYIGDARDLLDCLPDGVLDRIDRKSTRLLQSLMRISYAVFCLKKKIKTKNKQ